MIKDFLRVGIVADDKTAKGTKSAKKNISSLERSVNKLGKTFAGVFAAQKLVQYTKLSAKAAAQDQASAAKLANSLKNLGLQYTAPYIEDYISKLEQQSKIADDELRPAFQTLITQTSDLALSQKLLSTALNVSRGSGVGLSQVVSDLSQAYVGNTKGLKKYYLGLTNAELAASSFADIQKLLNSQFAGASQSYLNTYQGQIDTLSLAFGNLQESAGRAFFTLLGGTGGSASGAGFFARFIEGIGIGLEKTAQSVSDYFVRQTMSGNEFDAYVAKRNGAPAPVPGRELFRSSSSNNFALMKLEKDRQALIKKQLDAQKKLTAEQKKQAALKKAGSIFDLEQIQIIAALKGKLSEEDKLRLKLQLALLTENESEAAKLSKQLAMSIDSTGKLAEYLTTLPDAKNPFKGWDEWLKSFKSNLSTVTGGVMTDASSFAGVVPSTNVAPVTDPNAVTGFAPGGVTTAGGQVIKVDLNVDGKTLASVLQDASLSGNQVYVDRLTGRFYQ